MVRVGSLCTGYGGLEMGLAEYGVDVVTRWHAETAPELAPVLSHHGPNLGDITRADFTNAPRVDVVTAGFPCQPVSVAGRRKAQGDDRWLWPHVHRAIAQLNPRVVLLENVPGLVSTKDGRAWHDVAGGLLHSGYSVRWTVVGACHVGAAHHRHRLFIVARRNGQPHVEAIPGPRCDRSDLLPTPTARGPGSPTFWAQRRLQRPTEGIPLDAEVALAVEGRDWGRFTPALRLHVRRFGRMPRPTDPNTNGKPRMRAVFGQWLMGLPPGHVTDHVTGVDAFRAIGNGVMPAQLARALDVLGWP